MLKEVVHAQLRSCSCTASCSILHVHMYTHDVDSAHSTNLSWTSSEWPKFIFFCTLVVRRLHLGVTRLQSEQPTQHDSHIATHSHYSLLSTRKQNPINKSRWPNVARTLYNNWIFNNFFLVSFEIYDLYLTFKSKKSAVFYIFTATIIWDVFVVTQWTSNKRY